MLWAYFKSFLSPCWTWSTLSPISQCENLVGILKLRLTKVEDPSLTLGPPGVCNSHTCCTEPPAICQSRFRFPPWCPWRFVLAPFCSGKWDTLYLPVSLIWGMAIRLWPQFSDRSKKIYWFSVCLVFYLLLEWQLPNSSHAEPEMKSELSFFVPLFPCESFALFN